MPTAFGIDDSVVSSVIGMGETATRMLRNEAYGKDCCLSSNIHFLLLHGKGAPNCWLGS